METVVKLAVAEIVGLKVDNSQVAYEKILAYADEYWQQYHDIAIGAVPGIEYARNLFKKIGIDPTKRRPSSEALLRRALKQKGFFSINSLVDIGNWCSLEYLLPICVYDGSNVSGKLGARLGNVGEGYIAIDGKYLDLSGRYLVFDKEGAIGSPIKDSMRTRVTETTQEAVLLIYSPEEISDIQLEKYLATFVSRVLAECGGNLLNSEIIKVVLN